MAKLLDDTLANTVKDIHRDRQHTRIDRTQRRVGPEHFTDTTLPIGVYGKFGGSATPITAQGTYFIDPADGAQYQANGELETDEQGIIVERFFPHVYMIEPSCTIAYSNSTPGMRVQLWLTYQTQTSTRPDADSDWGPFGSWSLKTGPGESKYSGGFLADVANEAGASLFTALTPKYRLGLALNTRYRIRPAIVVDDWSNVTTGNFWMRLMVTLFKRKRIVRP